MLDAVILVLDGAECSGAVPSAGALAARLSSRVVVVRVCSGDDDRKVLEMSEPHLESIRASGVAVTAEPLAAGRRDAAAVVAQAALSHGARLIVVACGASNGDGMAHGAGSELLLAAPCPVVSVPAPTTPAVRAA
ncbi:MAG: hypothetical protein ACTHNU_08960 [Gaiellales bacterium]